MTSRSVGRPACSLPFLSSFLAPLTHSSLVRLTKPFCCGGRSVGRSSVGASSQSGDCEELKIRSTKNVAAAAGRDPEGRTDADGRGGGHYGTVYVVMFSTRTIITYNRTRYFTLLFPSLPRDDERTTGRNKHLPTDNHDDPGRNLTLTSPSSSNFRSIQSSLCLCQRGMARRHKKDGWDGMG